MKRRMWLSIGSNVGDRLAYLQSAVTRLSAIGPVRCSRVYETTPVGVEGQPDYLNAAIELLSDLSPRELLALCMEIEAAAGRERIVRWGARTLDVDIIAIEGDAVDEADLQIPHPRAVKRDFVLIPLHELAAVTDTGLPKRALAETPGAVRLTELQLTLESR